MRPIKALESYYQHQFLFYLLIGAVLTLILLTQQTVAQGLQIADTDKPSVYIEIETGFKPARSRERSRMREIILRLHNNTNAPINVPANFNIEQASQIEDGVFSLPDGGSGTFLKAGSEVELCYDAEGLFVQKGYSAPRKTPDPLVADLRNSCSYRFNGKDIQSPYESGFWIKPKTFIRFRAPSRLLEENLKLYTVFSYSWEFDKGMLRRNEPRHKVYVFYFDVPN